MIFISFRCNVKDPMCNIGGWLAMDNDRWAEKIEVHVGRLEAGSISDLQFPSAGIC